MSATIVQCAKCGAQNLGTAQFCGSCGAPAMMPSPTNHAVPNATAPQMVVPQQGTQNWHEMAGLICGVASIFMCGVLAALPGLYFSYKARTDALQEGRSTTMATVGLGLNGLGVVMTVGVGILFIILTIAAASAGQPDPMMDYNAMPNPYGF